VTDDLGEALDRIETAKRARQAAGARQVTAWQCTSCDRLFHSRTAAERHCSSTPAQRAPRRGPR